MKPDQQLAAGENEVAGIFWVENGPRVHGTLARLGSEVRVTTNGIAREPKSFRFHSNGVELRVDKTGDPNGVAADFRPLPLMGELEDDRVVTLLDARLTTGGLPALGIQVFYGTRLLEGAHVSSNSTRFSACRIGIVGPWLWEELFKSSDLVELGTPSGRLGARSDGRIGWIELTLPRGLSDREWERLFWTRILGLLRLWTHLDVTGERLQLSLGVEHDWLELRVSNTKEGQPFNPHASLLQPNALRLDQMASGLVLFDEMAPISDIASRHLVYEINLELAVLVNAACLEGFHRRRHLTTGSTKKMVFADRLRQLLPPVTDVVPGLVGQDTDRWVKALVDARNLEAHQWASGVTNWEERNDNYYQLAVSAEWVLRISMLLALGVAPGDLRSRLLDHQAFLFVLANMDHCQYPWPGSRLSKFRESASEVTE